MNLIGGPYAGGQLELMAGDSGCVIVAEYRIDRSTEENVETSVYSIYDVCDGDLVYNREETHKVNPSPQPTPTGE